MVVIFGLFLLTLLVITAIGIIRSEGLFSAVMLSGIFSLLMAANFFVLNAADVALTEAAVGAGVATVLLLGALALTPTRERPARRRSRWLAIFTVVANVAVITYATFNVPLLGDPMAPVHQHVAPWYLDNTMEYVGIPNVVTAVLASFRGYDTLGEVFVILIAGIGVLFLLSAGRDQVLATRPEPRLDSGLKHHLIPQVVSRMLIPFIVLFGLYVQFHGEYSPGGGFQAGAIVAAGMILYSVIEGESAAMELLPPKVLMALAVGGSLLYGLVGVVCMLLGGAFLDYSVLAADPVVGQHIGIIAIELGVGLAVTGVLLSIYHAFASRHQ
jgi:multicomponent Na+:H+ antiporter subunit B